MTAIDLIPGSGPPGTRSLLLALSYRSSLENGRVCLTRAGGSCRKDWTTSTGLRVSGTVRPSQSRCRVGSTLTRHRRKNARSTIFTRWQCSDGMRGMSLSERCQESVLPPTNYCGFTQPSLLTRRVNRRRARCSKNSCRG